MMDPVDSRPALANVIVPVLNEERHIRGAAASMRGQHYRGDIEFLFIDGGSTDATLAVLYEIAATDTRIRVLDNPARTTPHALNIGLREARGEYIVRMDAHSHFPSHYIARGVARLERGSVACVTGAAVPHGVDPSSRRTALALQSLIGTGGSAFRHARDHEIEVHSGPFGVWRRHTLEALGGWDEDWPVNQDAELAARVRKAGGTIVMLPELSARYIPRSGFRAIARQYGRYGFYRAKTSLRHPETFRLAHLLPTALTGVVVAAAVAPRPFHWVSRPLLGGYFGVLVAGSARAGARGSLLDAALLPAVFFTMHLSWGTGFVAGLLRFARAERSSSAGQHRALERS